MSSLDQLDPRLAPWAKYLVALGGSQLQVTSVYRSHAQQVELYRRWLAGKNRYPVARPGTSYHEYRRAWDMIGPEALLEQLGRLWESWGGKWGGNPTAGHQRDVIHFQA